MTEPTAPMPSSPDEPIAPDRTARRRPARRVALGLAAVALAGGGTAVAAGLAGGGAAEPPAARAQAGPPAEERDGVVDAATAAEESGEVEQIDPLAPLPKARPKAIAPVAGQATEDAGDEEAAARARASAAEEMTLPKPTGPASKGTSRSAGPAVSGLQADKATALPNGVALPPLEAPEAVMQVIRAGNTIARTPYKWGGGHGNFKDNGYDCSGSVTYALFAAGLIEGSRTSGQLETWGRPGKGRWITVYANAGHTFMEVAGIRFDTSGARRTGSRWQNEFRPTSGYVVRHPPGL